MDIPINFESKGTSHGVVRQRQLRLLHFVREGGAGGLCVAGFGGSFRGIAKGDGATARRQSVKMGHGAFGRDGLISLRQWVPTADQDQEAAVELTVQRNAVISPLLSSGP